VSLRLSPCPLPLVRHSGDAREEPRPFVAPHSAPSAPPPCGCSSRLTACPCFPRQSEVLLIWTGKRRASRASRCIAELALPCAVLLAGFDARREAALPPSAALPFSVARLLARLLVEALIPGLPLPGPGPLLLARAKGPLLALAAGSLLARAPYGPFILIGPANDEPHLAVFIG